MTNSKNENPKPMQSKPRSWRVWGLTALALLAVVAAAPSLLGVAEAASANGRTFEITFTKWVTVPPNMIGVVGGDVGPGAFAGEILSMETVNNITNLEADYHINGSKHSFSAKIHAVQDNLAGTGKITGQVTEGWLKGRSLTGEYTVIAACPISTGDVNYYGTMCFQGTLELVPAP